MTPEVLIVLVAVFAACFTHGAVGFGNAMVMLPLLGLALSVQVAVPVVALLAPFVTLYVLYYNRSGFDKATVLWLLVASLFGLPVGLAILTMGAPDSVTRILGILLMLYAVYALYMEYRVRRKGPVVPEDPTPEQEFNWWRDRAGAAGAGFLSGITAGAFSMNGPPVIIYGSACAWPREKFKSVLQGYFFVNNIFLVISHAASGLTTKAVLFYAAVGAPAAVIGLLIGERLSGKFNQNQFRIGVLILIFILGGVLLI
jgi:hypothetical protein